MHAPMRRNAWILGRTAWLLGKRDAARELYRAAESDASHDWPRLLDRARCERALGDLVSASATLVTADESAEASEGREPDVLAETASLFFEADGELEHPEAKRRAPGEVYRKALALHKTHEATLVGLFELGRFNWNRQSRPAHEILSELLSAKPKSVAGLLAGASADIDDGRSVAAREKMEELRALAPKRRELRTLDATLAWIEHRREECDALLRKLEEEDASDSEPRREIARHLSELYRFAEAAPFAQAAVERDPQDYQAWTELGRALSNTGDEEHGLEALRKSQELAAGRQNAWRHNTILVLERIHSKFVKESGSGQLSYAWTPQAADVLRTYWMPFYESAREELARRYGYTPGPTTIEVFDRFQDFSVRSTGFEGFPALGVCFGPVVTSVAPQSELRGKFSWARTSFHEFTHVIHLGLSHNRCPRWITEGLATWEEENKNPAWTRNMRRDLLDAYYNGELIPGARPEPRLPFATHPVRLLHERPAVPHVDREARLRAADPTARSLRPGTGSRPSPAHGVRHDSRGDRPGVPRVRAAHDRAAQDRAALELDQRRQTQVDVAFPAPERSRRIASLVRRLVRRRLGLLPERQARRRRASAAQADASGRSSAGRRRALRCSSAPRWRCSRTTRKAPRNASRPASASAARTTARAWRSERWP
jgi:tetratricopeptide (TPR) repeat protein